MLIQGQAGTQTVPSGQVAPLRLGLAADLIMSELHGRYYEQTVRGKMFHVATQALVTTTVGLATTYTGLVLSNPITSGVDLVLNKASMMQSVLQATQVEGYALAVGFNNTTNVTHTTPVVAKSCRVGSGLTAIGLADVSATLPTAPTYSHFFTNTGTATANSTGPQVVDLEGSVVLVPGAYVCFVSPTQASVAGLWFGFQWEEVPTFTLS